MTQNNNVHVLFTDINECDENLDNCDDNAECENEPGTFTCTCEDGYTGNGEECTGMCSYFLSQYKMLLIEHMQLSG